METRTGGENEAAKPAGSRTVEQLEKEVWDALRTCYDPEIPVNIVDLGLVYDCRLIKRDGAGTRVEVKMTLTAPGCGMGCENGSRLPKGEPGAPPGGNIPPGGIGLGGAELGGGKPPGGGMY